MLGRDRTVRNYFMHDLTFPSLCLLLRRKAEFLSDQERERCSIPTSSAKNKHTELVLYFIIQTIWRVKKNLAGCPLHSTRFVCLCPALLLVEIHLLEPFPTSVSFPMSFDLLASPASTQFLFGDGSGESSSPEGGSGQWKSSLCCCDLWEL